MALLANISHVELGVSVTVLSSNRLDRSSWTYKRFLIRYLDGSTFLGESWMSEAGWNGWEVPWDLHWRDPMRGWGESLQICNLYLIEGLLIPSEEEMELPKANEIFWS